MKVVSSSIGTNVCAEIAQNLEAHIEYLKDSEKIVFVCSSGANFYIGIN